MYLLFIILANTLYVDFELNMDWRNHFYSVDDVLTESFVALLTPKVSCIITQLSYLHVHHSTKLKEFL